MNKEIVKQHIIDCAAGCKHEFIVVSQKNNETSTHATQLMCSRCLILLNFQDIAESCGEIKTAYNEGINHTCS